MVPGAAPGEVAEVELVRMELPLRRPLASAHGVEVHRELVLVRVTLQDGTEGWGECSALTRPTYTSEYAAGAWAILRDELVPALLAGREGDVVGHPMAEAAVASALTDARSRRRGRRLVDVLASGMGPPAEAVPVTAVVGRDDDVDNTVAEVAARVAEGAAAVKLKVTPRPVDLDAVAAVRSSWPDLPLAVDGNGSLDARSVAILDGHDLIYLEQPLAAEDLVGSAALARRVAAPIALDESATSVGAVRTALALGSASVVNLKPARFGGPVRAAEAVRTLADDGAHLFVGGMVESAVGRAAALAVAALPGFGFPTDLGPSGRYYAHDVGPGPGLREGRLVVPIEPGAGATPDPAGLDRMATERLVLPASR